MKISQSQENYLLFFSIVLAGILISEAGTYFLDLNAVLYKNLSEELTLKQIDEYFAREARWGWVGYILFPVSFYLKTTVIAWVLAIGGFFSQVQLSHKDYWRTVLLAELMFLFSGIFKILWFLLVDTDYTFGEVNQFIPFSLYSLMDTSAIPVWAIYPLQLLNAFEAAYWVFLVVLINQSTKSNKGLGIVALSYGPALLFWMILIMFLSLNLS